MFLRMESRIILFFPQHWCEINVHFITLVLFCMRYSLWHSARKCTISWHTHQLRKRTGLYCKVLTVCIWNFVYYLILQVKWLFLSHLLCSVRLSRVLCYFYIADYISFQMAVPLYTAVSLELSWSFTCSSTIFNRSWFKILWLIWTARRCQLCWFRYK